LPGESVPEKQKWYRLNPYYKKLISTCMIIVGTFLIVEHIWTFGRLDLLDIIGHEYHGLGLILAAFIWMTDKNNGKS
jgi:hypothetical protein